MLSMSMRIWRSVTIRWRRRRGDIAERFRHLDGVRTFAFRVVLIIVVVVVVAEMKRRKFQFALIFTVVLLSPTHTWNNLRTDHRDRAREHEVCPWSPFALAPEFEETTCRTICKRFEVNDEGTKRRRNELDSCQPLAKHLTDRHDTTTARFDIQTLKTREETRRLECPKQVETRTSGSSRYSSYHSNNSFGGWVYLKKIGDER